MCFQDAAEGVGVALRNEVIQFDDGRIAKVSTHRHNGVEPDC